MKFLPYFTGDGVEYTAASFAFFQHGTPEIKKSDIRKIIEYHDKINVAYLKSALEEIKLVDDISESVPYSRGKDGKFYSFHFWLYSLVNVPALAFVMLLHLPMTYSFFLTNLVLVWLATGAIIASRNTLSQKLLLIVFYLFGTAFYYVQWQHPEVFTASLLLIALLLLEERRYLYSAFLAALCAQQNPPIGFLALIAFIFDFWIHRKSLGGKKVWLLFLLKWASVVPVLFLAPLFYFWKFGSPNLISSMGWSDGKLISIRRILELFFDPNQGMVLAIPTAFLLIFILLLSAVLRWRENKIFLWRPVAFLALALLFAIPSTATVMMNSDCCIFMRYASWILIPVGFALKVLVGKIKWQFPLVVCFALTQICIFFAWRANRYSAAHYGPVGKWVLAHFPHAYNPSQDVFAVRGVHAHLIALSAPEFFMKKGWALREGGAKDIFFLVTGGVITKVLFHESDAEELGKFRAEFFVSGSGAQLSRERRVLIERGWYYLNCAEKSKVALEDGLYSYGEFQDAPLVECGKRYYESLQGAYMRGWGWGKGRVRWSVEPISLLSFRLGGLDGSPARMTLFGESNKAHTKQAVEIHFNGVPVFKGLIDDSGSLSFDLPTEAISAVGERNLLTLRWKILATEKPGDWRGFSCQGMRIDTGAGSGR
jgi:hypothetical protein